MEPRNLAIVFGPTLVRTSEDNMTNMVTHMPDQYRIVETLIQKTGVQEANTVESQPVPCIDHLLSNIGRIGVYPGDVSDSATGDSAKFKEPAELHCDDSPKEDTSKTELEKETTGGIERAGFLKEKEDCVNSPSATSKDEMLLRKENLSSEEPSTSYIQKYRRSPNPISWRNAQKDNHKLTNFQIPSVLEETILDSGTTLSCTSQASLQKASCKRLGGPVYKRSEFFTADVGSITSGYSTTSSTAHLAGVDSTVLGTEVLYSVTESTGEEADDESSEVISEGRPVETDSENDFPDIAASSVDRLFRGKTQDMAKNLRRNSEESEVSCSGGISTPKLDSRRLFNSYKLIECDTLSRKKLARYKMESEGLRDAKHEEDIKKGKMDNSLTTSTRSEPVKQEPTWKLKIPDRLKLHLKSSADDMLGTGNQKSSPAESSKRKNIRRRHTLGGQRDFIESSVPNAWQIQEKYPSMEKDISAVNWLKAKSPSLQTTISEYVAQERLRSNPVDLKINKTEKVNVSQLDDSSKAESSFSAELSSGGIVPLLLVVLPLKPDANRKEDPVELTKTLKNLMEPRNLAIVFGPTLVRTSEDNMTNMVTHMPDQYRIVETLIQNMTGFSEKMMLNNLLSSGSKHSRVSASAMHRSFTQQHWKDWSISWRCISSEDEWDSVFFMKEPAELHCDDSPKEDTSKTELEKETTGGRESRISKKRKTVALNILYSEIQEIPKSHLLEKCTKDNHKLTNFQIPSVLEETILDSGTTLSCTSQASLQKPRKRLGALYIKQLLHNILHCTFSWCRFHRVGTEVLYSVTESTGEEADDESSEVISEGRPVETDSENDFPDIAASSVDRLFRGKTQDMAKNLRRNSEESEVSCSGGISTPKLDSRRLFNSYKLIECDTLSRKKLARYKMESEGLRDAKHEEDIKKGKMDNSLTTSTRSEPVKQEPTWKLKIPDRLKLHLKSSADDMLGTGNQKSSPAESSKRKTSGRHTLGDREILLNQVSRMHGKFKKIPKHGERHFSCKLAEGKIPYVAQERLRSNPVDLKINKTEKVNVSQLDDSSKAESSFSAELSSGGDSTTSSGSSSSEAWYIKLMEYSVL
ncbi:hypothetical protein E2320_001675 [Naja naja]|nr:hypothetical protein E2320_001675 [Naja naja]